MAKKQAEEQAENVPEVTTSANDEIVAPDPTEDQRTILRLEAEIKGMQTKFDSLVMYVNNYIESTSSRISKIDQIAFAGLYLHGGSKPFTLSPTVVDEGKELVAGVLKTNSDYAKILEEAHEKAVAKQEKEEAKKAKVKAARDKRKGKVVKEDAKTA